MSWDDDYNQPNYYTESWDLDRDGPHTYELVRAFCEEHAGSIGCSHCNKLKCCIEAEKSRETSHERELRIQREEIEIKEQNEKREKREREWLGEYEKEREWLEMLRIEREKQEYERFIIAREDLEREDKEREQKERLQKEEREKEKLGKKYSKNKCKAMRRTWVKKSKNRKGHCRRKYYKM